MGRAAAAAPPENSAFGTAAGGPATRSATGGRMLEAVAPPSRTHRFARLRPILRLPSHLTPAAGLSLCRAAGLALCRTAGLTLCRTAALTLCRTAGLTLCRAAGLALCRAAGLALCLAPSLAPCAAAQAPVLAGAPHALAESDLQSLAQLA